MVVLKTRCGSVTMEMVIICVLIAAACLLAIIAFGRTIRRNADVMDKGLTGRGNRAGEVQSCPNEGYRKMADEDIKEAVKFAGEFSDTKE